MQNLKKSAVAELIQKQNLYEKDVKILNKGVQDNIASN